MTELQIVVTEQGPYEVKDGDESSWLCRCGGSSNKPFCDGTHSTRDWDGSCTASASSYDERAKAYPGEGIVMRDDRSICEHAGFCTAHDTTAWKLSKQTADPAAREMLEGMIDRCPSGALTRRVTGEGPDVEAVLAQAVEPLPNGPLFVTGRVPVERFDGVPLESRNRMTLCRCGASQNKPLCDGSHVAAGFQG